MVWRAAIFHVERLASLPSSWWTKDAVEAIEAPATASYWEQVHGSTLGRRAVQAVSYRNIKNAWWQQAMNCDRLRPPDHARGPATVKARSSIVERRVAGTIRSADDAVCAISIGVASMRQEQAIASSCSGDIKTNVLHSWICTWNCCHQKPFST